jgi:uncharacterized membrane protein
MTMAIDTRALKTLNSKVKTTTPSKTNGGEWIMVILALAIVDVAQVILDLFAIGVAVNRFIDIIVALTLALYLFLRGELSDPDTRIRIIAILIISFGLEEVPILDAAPFWTGDALYFWHLANKRTVKAKAQEETKQKQQKIIAIQSQNERLSRIYEMRERLQLQKEAEEEAIEESNIIEASGGLDNESNVLEDDEDLYEKAM